VEELEKPEIEKLVNSGDENSLKQLFEHFYGRIYATVMAITRDHQAAEDLTQEAFIRGFNQITKLREPSRFGAWLGSIATNLARDYLKKEKRFVWTSDIEQGNPSSQPSVEEQLLEREKVATLREALRTLPPEQHQVVILYYYYETRVEDIASFCGISAGTVKSRLHRARRKLFDVFNEGELKEALNRPRSTEERGGGHERF